MVERSGHMLLGLSRWGWHAIQSEHLIRVWLHLNSFPSIATYYHILWCAFLESSLLRSLLSAVVLLFVISRHVLSSTSTLIYRENKGVAWTLPPFAFYTHNLHSSASGPQLQTCGPDWNTYRLSCRSLSLWSKLKFSKPTIWQVVPAMLPTCTFCSILKSHVRLELK